MPAPPLPEFRDPPEPTSFRAPAAAKGSAASGGEEVQLLWKIAASGFQLVAIVGAALFGGWLLDRWLGTSPRWTGICGVAGIVLGILDFIRVAVRLNRRLDVSARAARSGPRRDEGRDARDRGDPRG
ncbi:MAG: AtpZ/AtpI family protein [Phycisphaerales bacterium]